MQLTADQQNASTKFTQFLLDQDEKYFVIQGSSGSGKSTLVKHLVDGIDKKYKMLSLLLQDQQYTEKLSICLTATTNQAAVILGNLAGEEAQTIHSRLGLVMYDDYSTGEQKLKKGKKWDILKNTILFIDEYSYINNELLDFIEEATLNCKVVFIGDRYQLTNPSQSHCAVDSIQCVRVELKEIMRNQGLITSTGADFRDAVDTGVFQAICPNGVDIMRVDGDTFLGMIKEAHDHVDYHRDFCKVLAYHNTRVGQYNNHIRKVKGYPLEFAPGEYVITNKSIIQEKHVIYRADAPVYIHNISGPCTRHGAGGRLISLGKNGDEFFAPYDISQAKQAQNAAAAEHDWPTYFHIKNEWLDLRPIYSRTVHKAQGSTFDYVFLDLYDIAHNPIPEQLARMMYVAITRASKKVILYGDLPRHYGGAL